MMPLIKLIESPCNKYAYDTNTNSLIKISDELYKLLKDEKIKDLEICNEFLHLRSKGYFLENRVQELCHPATNLLADLTRGHLSQVVLQLTQNCNLRCNYCPYSGDGKNGNRSHSNKRMTFELARQIVNYLIDHSGDLNEIGIGFYGGEPLLEMSLIKKVVKYAKDNIKSKNIRFSITTNAMLLNTDIFSYLLKNNFSILISIDGPKEIHDVSRKTLKGDGSFDIVYENLKKLQRKFGDSIYNQITINAVMRYDYDFDLYKKMCDDDLLKKFKVNISFVDTEFMKSKINTIEDFTYKYRYELFLRYMKELNEKSQVRASHLLDSVIYGIFRQVDEFHTNKYKLLPECGVPSGPCIPGVKRIMVDCDGNFYPCEKVSELSNDMKIGNIYQGINLAKVSKIINVSQITEGYCKDCWAFTLCNQCARQADMGNGMKKELRLSNCNVQKENALEILKMVILENEVKKR